MEGITFLVKNVEMKKYSAPPNVAEAIQKFSFPTLAEFTQNFKISPFHLTILKRYMPRTVTIKGTNIKVILPAKIQGQTTEVNQ